MKVDTRIEIGMDPIFVVRAETEADHQLLTLVIKGMPRIEFGGKCIAESRVTSFNFTVRPEVAPPAPATPRVHAMPGGAAETKFATRADYEDTRPPQDVRVYLEMAKGWDYSLDQAENAPPGFAEAILAVKDLARRVLDTEDALSALPKTADGGLVVPGMMLWTFECANPAGLGARVLPGDFKEWSTWYSTREAMEEARSRSLSAPSKSPKPPAAQGF